MEGEDELAGPVLSRAWYNLRLSVRCPARAPTWDAILLTATSPQQALLYQWHLQQAKRRGTIHDSTIAIAVPDPEGARIGSGGATLHAIRSLAYHTQQQVKTSLPTSRDNLAEGGSITCLRRMTVLLIHAGGDSKRVPWANPMGKAFLPVPFLADKDPDSPMPSLFDHILALCSFAAPHFRKQGGLFVMTGDVLPCYDFSSLCLLENGACVVTVPASPELAANHGVILASASDEFVDFSFYTKGEKQAELVMNLLQKPSHQKLEESGAIRKDSTVLLDTGIFAVQGKAWRDLIELSLEEPDPVLALLHDRTEVSLYEELAGAWVPACHDCLRKRPLGMKLIKSLSSQRLYSYCAQGLSFLHFGTSFEVLAHLANGQTGRSGRRHMILSPDIAPSKIATSAVIVSSEISGTGSVGEGSLVFNSTFTSTACIGSHCIVIGIHLTVSPQIRNTLNEVQYSFCVPDWHCIWEVPVHGGLQNRVSLCCSVTDNPKLTQAKMGTFCGKLWRDFFIETGIEEQEIWPNGAEEDQDLWSAKLFAVVPPGLGLLLAMWLMGMYRGESHGFLNIWRSSERVSMGAVHKCIDFEKLCMESSLHQSQIALRLAEASLNNGSLDRDLSKLCTQIVEGINTGDIAYKKLLAICSGLQDTTLSVPASRVQQARLDLYNATGNTLITGDLENNVWDAVVTETTIAIGKRDNMMVGRQPIFMSPPSSVKVELPVRVDFVGGWSDTPPWSLERIGCVLNMAILLNGSAPIGVEITMMTSGGISVTDDEGHWLHIDDPSVITTPFKVDDPFRLVKSALLVTGLVGTSSALHYGLKIRTWANVPRGSGLGTSSILAAAVVEGLLRISCRDHSKENVTNLVLLLEQLMGTGGGWQDQIGGLYPGIKCTTSYPKRPLSLKVEPVSVVPSFRRQFEERLVVFFTGQVGRKCRRLMQLTFKLFYKRMLKSACLTTLYPVGLFHKAIE